MKVLHAPQHMFSEIDANLNTIAKLKPVLSSLTEQDAGRKDSVARIKKRLGSKYHVCAAEKGPGHEREVIVLVRKAPGRKIDSVQVLELSKDFGPGIANDRYMIVVRLRGPLMGKGAHIVTHWNAAIQNDNGTLNSTPRARAMDRQAGPALDMMLQNLAGEGRWVTGSADFNYKMSRPKALVWKYAPLRIFSRNNIKCMHQGLDYLWFSKHFKLKKFRVIPAGTAGNHSDHPWLLVNLKKRKVKKKTKKRASK